MGSIDKSNRFAGLLPMMLAKATERNIKAICQSDIELTAIHGDTATLKLVNSEGREMSVDVQVKDGKVVAMQEPKLTEAEKVRQQAKEQAEKKLKAEVISKVKVIDVEAKTYTNLIGKDTYIITKYRNDSDRTIRQVKFTLYFLDKNGNPIQERTTIAYRTLKPGYIEQDTYEAYPVPEWAGKVKVEVTDLEIVKETT
jgi:hypothetical protein